MSAMGSVPSVSTLGLSPKYGPTMEKLSKYWSCAQETFQTHAKTDESKEVIQEKIVQFLDETTESYKFIETLLESGNTEEATRVFESVCQKYNEMLLSCKDQAYFDETFKMLEHLHELSLNNLNLL